MFKNIEGSNKFIYPGVIPPWPTLSAKESLRKEINTLPDTSIKLQLEKRIIPYLTAEPPFSRTFGGAPIDVLSVNVFFEYQAKGRPPRGYFSPQFGTGNLTTHTAESYPSLEVPLVIGMKSEESMRSRLLDGTPTIQTSYSWHQKVITGLHPYLGIVRANDVPAKNFADYLKDEQFAFIKEACTWLICDVLLEETIDKMKKNSMKTTLLLRNKVTGEDEEVEGGINLLKEAFNNDGRTAALIDITGYLLAFKATEGTPYYDLMAQIPHFKTVIDEMRDFDYGITAPDLLYNASRKALQMRSVRELHYVGNLSQLP